MIKVVLCFIIYVYVWVTPVLLLQSFILFATIKKELLTVTPSLQVHP